MKVLAYYALHYGSEYLYHSIAAISRVVTDVVVLYTPKPSYGHTTSLKCPDSEDQLKHCAYAAFPRVKWVTIAHAGNEGEHRHHIDAFCAGYDLLLMVDADEIWDENSLQTALNYAFWSKSSHFEIAGFIHFWRSFNNVCLDRFAPGRIRNLHNHNNIHETIPGKVYHFGYAQSNAITQYKMAIHGHFDELRPQWLENIFLPWKAGNGDVHPCVRDLWNPISFDKTTLPDILKSHEYYNKDVIE